MYKNPHKATKTILDPILSLSEHDRGKLYAQLRAEHYADKTTKVFDCFAAAQCSNARALVAIRMPRAFATLRVNDMRA